MVRVLGLSSFVAWAACVCARSSPQLDTVCEEEELEEFSTLQLRGVLDVAATGPKSGMFGMEGHEEEEEDVEADDDEDDDKAAVLLGTDDLGADDQVKSSLLPESSRVSAKRWMQSGWVTDGRQPNFLRAKPQLFDLKWNKDVHATLLPGGASEWTNKESLSSTQSEISANMGVTASYGAFSGALDFSVNNGAVHTHKQMVAIRRTTVKSAEVVNNLHIKTLQQRMTAEALLAIDSATDAQEIVDFLGEFYVKKMSLGGVIETRFQQTQIESDSYDEFATSVEANVDLLFGVSATAAAGFTTSESATKSTMSLHVTTKVQGGETSFWLRSDPVDEIQTEWAASLEGGALVHPIAFILEPIWKLVKEVNYKKGQQVETLLTSQWETASLRLEHFDHLAPVPALSRLVLAEGVYRIQQKKTGHFLDALTGPTVNNWDHQVVTTSRNNNPSQLWYIASTNDENMYTIRQVGDNDRQGVKYVGSRYPGVYLPRHAAGDRNTYSSISSAQARCDELADACGGITCSSETSCTVRAGRDLRVSHHGSFSYQKVFPGLNFVGRHPGVYLAGGYAAFDSTTYSISLAQARCAELADACGGITCSSGTSCTVRAGRDLRASQHGSFSYLKVFPVVPSYLDAHEQPHTHLGHNRAVTRPSLTQAQEWFRTEAHSQEWFLTVSDYAADTFTIQQNVAAHPYLDAQSGSRVITSSLGQSNDLQRWKFIPQ